MQFAAMSNFCVNIHISTSYESTATTYVNLYYAR